MQPLQPVECVRLSESLGGRWEAGGRQVGMPKPDKIGGEGGQAMERPGLRR